MKIKEVSRTLFGGSIVYVLMAACSGVTNSPTGGGSTGQAGHGGAGGMATSSIGGFGGMAQSGSGGLGGMAQSGSGGFGGMAQTGSGGMGQGGSNFDAGGIWDALTDPVPDASADPTSGTRLKAKYRMGADGSKEYINGTWFDSQRNEDCSFATAMDGQLRCLPNLAQAYVVESIFSDASCTKPVATVSDSCTHKYAIAYETAVCMAGSQAIRVYNLGAQVSTIYYKSGANCFAGTISPPSKYYSLGTEVLPSSFVSATIGIDP